MRVKEMPVVLVSLCLLGANCRYDGGSNPCEGLARLLPLCRVAPLCPEQLGGLPTPRIPAERRGDAVVTRDGADVTAAFDRGAAEVCRLARLLGARYALLKSRSPSCGAGEIYDGSFTGARVPGDGVAAAALRRLGVRVYHEGQLGELIARLEDDEA